MAKHEPGWVYIALDAEPEHFGDALGELNRTSWIITGSEEMPPDQWSQAPPRVWQRIYAKKRIKGFAQLFDP